MKILWRLCLAAKPYRIYILVGLVLSVLVTACDLSAPLLVRSIIALLEKKVGGQRTDLVSILKQAGLLALVYLVRGVSMGLGTYANHQAGHRTARDIRLRLYRHFQALSMKFHHGQKTGELMARLTSDAQSFEGVVAHGLPGLLINSCLVLGAAVILFTLNWKMALVSMLAIPPLILVMLNFIRVVLKAFRRTQKKWGEVSALLQDKLSGMAVIQSFVREAHEEERFSNELNEHLNYSLTSVKAFATRLPLLEYISSLGTILVMGYGGYLVFRGEMGIPELVAFLMYVAYFFRPVLQFGQMSEMFQRAIAGGERIFQILEREPLIKEKPDAIAPDVLQHEIEFRNVSFDYHEDAPALRDVSFTVEEGKTTALVGVSGSGKTTVINLVSRFYDPTQGTIYLGGYDLRDFKVDYLRDRIAIVLQDVFLFAGTVRENIAYGKLDASDEEIEAAATLANAHQFIEQLAERYDTEIGERGVTLSGGQKQRLAIARAILKNAPILILDEATSSVDVEAEKLIREAMDRLTQDRTTIVIAHRLSTVQHADKITVLENGRVVESGRHADLLALGGVYSRLYHLQFEIGGVVQTLP